MADDTAFAVCLTKHEASEATVGMAFLTLHHQEQIREWSVRPRGDRRRPLVRVWEDGHAKIIAHHEEQIRQASALCGKIGGRDWIAAEANTQTSLREGDANG